MVLLNNDAFLVELTKLFQKAKPSGSVLMTLKRYDGRTKPVPREGREPSPPATEYRCLLRASCRSCKISTVVEQRRVELFTSAYSTLLRANISALKRIKKLKKKSKATQ